jgi:hypothetical protein
MKSGSNGPYNAAEKNAEIIATEDLNTIYLFINFWFFLPTHHTSFFRKATRIFPLPFCYLASITSPESFSNID